MSKTSSGHEDRITADDVRGRRDAEALARTDFRRALAIARAVRHPWYRCQSLTSVAGAAASSELRDALLAEALDAAFEQSEPNRVACVGAWPLRAMVEARDPGAARVVRRLLDVIVLEPHGLRRLDGVAAVFGRVLDAPDLRAKVWRPFMEAAQASSGWRTERIVSWLAVSLASFDKKVALQLLAQRSANRFTEKARKEIAALAPSRDA